MLFEPAEYAERVKRTQAYLAERDLEYLLVLEPENVTYLTGFWTAGFSTSFQFVVLPASGEPTVVTRVVERYWMDATSPYAHAAIFWKDGEAAEDVMIRVLTELEVRGRVGIEDRSWRATAALVDRLATQLRTVSLIETGDDVSKLRLRKSAAEIAVIRRAGEVAETMMDVAVAEAIPGNSERHWAAQIVKAGVIAGQDDAFPGCLSSGARAREIHATYTDRVFENEDVIFAEISPEVSNYHARFMRSIVVGQPVAGFVDMAQRLTDVQDEALAAVRAGASCTMPDGIYRRGIESAGYVEHYPNKTFYGVGLLLWPNSLEPIEVTRSSDFLFEAGQTFHTYLSVGGFNLSETILITESGYDRLTNYTRELIRV